jgi:Fungal specific transcription factor domain
MSRTLPSSIAQLSNVFPLASNIHATSLDALLQSHLPSWSNACRLCDLYLEQAPWFFGAVTKRQLHEELLPVFYTEAPVPVSPIDLTATAAKPTSPKGTAHDLALLFVIFCFGTLTDVGLPSAPDNAEAEQYYQLTKAALTIEPVLERPPSVATVQTLALMAIYEGLCSGENSIESTWALMGMATKLAQSVGHLFIYVLVLLCILFWMMVASQAVIVLLILPLIWR